MNYNNMGSASGPGPLARQPSVYGLTLDELQNTIGAMGLPRDLGSMNMDDFLKNIWTAEESHAMASSSAAPALQRQGSLTLPRTLSHKTVDEVWRDFPDLHRQPTLGEMTLEEFLVRAGVVREDVDTNINTTLPPPPQIFTNSTNGHNSVFYGPGSNKNAAAPGLTLGFGQPALINGALPPNPAMSRVFPVSELPSPKRMRGAVGNGLMGGGAVVASSSPTNRISADGLAKSNGDLSSLSPAPYVFGGGLRMRKNGAVEKVVERRQKRMIKNRESAARSRARKQAYTMELESEIAKLKEQNECLQKKQVEIMEMQKNQVLEMINQQHIPKKRCLRRTQTGPW